MTGKNIRKLVLAALLAALTAVATMIIRIPTPTQGYIHLGDGMVLICGILLGPGLGALAAGIGSMMADLIGGYMAWVPGTFAIKALTALLGGWLYHRMAGKGMNTITRVVLCGIPAEIIMVLGYFVYEVGMEVVMGSSMGAAAAAVVLGVPMNIVQGIAGIIVGAVLLPVQARRWARRFAHDKWIGKTVPETEPFFYANFDLSSRDSLWNGGMGSSRRCFNCAVLP